MIHGKVSADMKYIFQLAIIMSVSFIGEVLHSVLPFPIPASVYGLILLFVLLVTKIVPLNKVEEVSEFMMAIMPLFFIEPTVGIMESFGLIQGKIAALFIASFFSFVTVLVVTGLTAQFMIRRKQKKQGGEEHESE